MAIAQEKMTEPSVAELKAELARTQAELEAIQKEYQEFAYICSHDFKAPFRQIEGFSKLIFDRHVDAFDAKTRKHLGLVIKGTEKCQHMISALLEYSRLNTLAAPFEAVDCEVVLNEQTRLLGRLIGSTGAKVIFNKPPVIQGDPTQIGQLFYHLLKNALMYHREQTPPKVSIVATHETDRWAFRITDNGIGIPEKQLHKIFTVFRRAVNDEQYPGEGMGLAIAKKIVERHGGKLWIESSESKGTSVYFTIADTVAEAG